jgi:negative regulator of flagellin synthesis FlgM
MRIDAYNQISQLYSQSTKVKAKSAQKTSERDQFQMSDSAKAYQASKKAVNEAPDVRADKVAELKNRIQSGTYDVSSEAFAEKILSNYDVFA